MAANADISTEVAERDSRHEHDEERPLLAQSPTPKVQPVAGVVTIIAVLLLGKMERAIIHSIEFITSNR